MLQEEDYHHHLGYRIATGDLWPCRLVPPHAIERMPSA
jgi:hypothetical protein